MSIPNISVIVPTYNRSIFLQECVCSILSQDYKDFELIVVDDGSTDGTYHILQQNFPHVKVLRQENQGVSSARNLGIANAVGQYLAFCDSDDCWKPNKLSKQYQFFQDHPEAVVCYTDEIWIRQGRRVNPCLHHTKVSGWRFEAFLELCLVSPSSVMMTRYFFDQVGLFDENLPACEDYDLWLRASLKFPFHYIPEPLIIKRGGHIDQLSKKFWGMDRFRVQALLKCLESYPLTAQQKQKTIEVLQKKCRILAEGAKKRGNMEFFQKYTAIVEQWEF